MADPHRRLIRALIERGGAGCRYDRGGSTPWASATFTGARHAIVLALPHGAADGFADLGEAEFAIPGHLVADIAVAARNDGPDGARLTIEALTIETW